MKNLLVIALIALACSTVGFAAETSDFAPGKGPEIRIVDHMVSIKAESVPLSRLLKLLDRATGMTSKVPPELANRNISVRFTNLPFEAAVKKIFEGQPLDYIMVAGQSIVVTGSSQASAADNSSAPYSPPPQNNVFVDDNSNFLPPQPPNGMNNQGQPAMIQTPFGPIANPRAQQQQGQQNGIQPMVMPGGQPAGQVSPQTTNPFNQSLPGFNGASPLPGLQTNPPFGSPANPPGGLSPSGFPTPQAPGGLRPIP